MAFPQFLGSSVTIKHDEATEHARTPKFCKRALKNPCRDYSGRKASVPTTALGTAPEVKYLPGTVPCALTGATAAAGSGAGRMRGGGAGRMRGGGSRCPSRQSPRAPALRPRVRRQQPATDTPGARPRAAAGWQPAPAAPGSARGCAGSSSRSARSEGRSGRCASHSAGVRSASLPLPAPLASPGRGVPARPPPPTPRGERAARP